MITDLLENTVRKTDFLEKTKKLPEQWSQVEIRLNVFRRPTIPQKRFIIIITLLQLCHPNEQNNKLLFSIAALLNRYL